MSESEGHDEFLAPQIGVVEAFPVLLAKKFFVLGRPACASMSPLSWPLDTYG